MLGEADAAQQRRADPVGGNRGKLDDGAATEHTEHVTRQAGLAGAAGADECDESAACESVVDGSDVRVAADQPARRRDVADLALCDEQVVVVFEEPAVEELQLRSRLNPDLDGEDPPGLAHTR